MKGNTRKDCYTDEESAYVERAWRAGIPTADIAARLERSERAIEARASHFQFPRPAWFIANARRRAQLAGGAARREAAGDHPPPAPPRPVGHRLHEAEITALYNGRQYDAGPRTDNQAGRLPPRPPSRYSAVSSLVGAL